MFVDQYSYLHFATGIIMYFWGVRLWIWILIHVLYEIFENLEEVVYIINKYITIWPGGKCMADTQINRIGDVVFGTLGWLSASYIDNLGNTYGWYRPHLQ